MSHKGHPGCEFTRKADCERAQRDALGRCKTLVEEDRTCSNWAVDERGYCGVHLASALARTVAAEREAERRALLDERIALYMEWVAEHPSVHDRMPAVGGR